MSDLVPFTDNFNDLSNADGYQFEFRCERCGNGYRSAFRRDPRAAGQKLARGLGNLFGGSLYEISSMADRLLDRGTNSPAKDEALRAATAEIAPRFHQCRACSDWVCGDVCWNDAVGQCVRCSPIATEELAAAGRGAPPADAGATRDGRPPGRNGSEDAGAAALRSVRCAVPRRQVLRRVRVTARRRRGVPRLRYRQPRRCQVLRGMRHVSGGLTPRARQGRSLCSGHD